MAMRNGKETRTTSASLHSDWLSPWAGRDYTPLTGVMLKVSASHDRMCRPHRAHACPTCPTGSRGATAGFHGGTNVEPRAQRLQCMQLRDWHGHWRHSTAQWQYRRARVRRERVERRAACVQIVKVDVENRRRIGVVEDTHPGAEGRRLCHELAEHDVRVGGGVARPALGQLHRHEAHEVLVKSDEFLDIRPALALPGVHALRRARAVRAAAVGGEEDAAVRREGARDKLERAPVHTLQRDVERLDGGDGLLHGRCFVEDWVCFLAFGYEGRADARRAVVERDPAHVAMHGRLDGAVRAQLRDVRFDYAVNADPLVGRRACGCDVCAATSLLAGMSRRECMADTVTRDEHERSRKREGRARPARGHTASSILRARRVTEAALAMNDAASAVSGLPACAGAGLAVYGLVGRCGGRKEVVRQHDRSESATAVQENVGVLHLVHAIEVRVAEQAAELARMAHPAVPSMVRRGSTTGSDAGARGSFGAERMTGTQSFTFHAPLRQPASWPTRMESVLSAHAHDELGFEGWLFQREDTRRELRVYTAATH
ncbi:hypothetical protein AURDEDRAFT_126238 [Auricularia subglabra TFB-10046 SS5]|nr:hypothetical protein AURDEDRAFT_126238 [Auricularia subglabra TFB-10046 SS5]